ncbi:MAG: IS91 family transposase [Rhodobacteraceae bacterium]|nr:IS91 family transposase [Paracoccaceae bacterium]
MHRITQRVARLLERQGLLVRDPDHDFLDFEPGGTFDQLVGASIHYRIAIGPNAGRKALTLRTVPAQPEPRASTLLAKQPGFSLHAATGCEANQRDQLEKLCRYITRPAIANERLSTNARGQIIYKFKQPFRDGTTHVVLDPPDFIARLAALVPRPRLNLTRFHGVFAPNCKHRESVVPTRKPGKEKPDKPLAPMTWMQRLKRVFAIDIETCPKCGGRLRVIACIEDPDTIAKILEHIRSREAAEPSQPRAPPPPSEQPDTPNQDRLF